MDGHSNRKGLRDIVMSIDIAQHHQARGDSAAHLNPAALRKCLARQGVNNDEPAGNRLLGISALGSWGAEICNEPVAGVVGEDATMFLNDGLASFIKDRQEGPEIFRIHRVSVVRGFYDIAT
jgi:hypothetical protein